MKILFDTNVFFSKLLGRGSGNHVKEAVQACLSDPDIEIEGPQEVLDEIRLVVSEKEETAKPCSVRALYAVCLDPG